MQESTRNLLLFRGRYACPPGGRFAPQILRDDGGQLNNLEVRGTIVPVVPPADDDVATGCRMTMLSEIAGFKFVFDSYSFKPHAKQAALRASEAREPSLVPQKSIRERGVLRMW